MKVVLMWAFLPLKLQIVVLFPTANKKRLTRVVNCLSTRSARILDRIVPPSEGAPWSYADVYSPVARILLSGRGRTSPPLTTIL